MWAGVRYFLWASFQQDADGYVVPARPCCGCRLSSDAPSVPGQGGGGTRQLWEMMESHLHPPAPEGRDVQCWERSEWRALMPKHGRWEPGITNTVSVSLRLKFTPVCFCFAQGWWQSHLSYQQKNNSAHWYSPPVSRTKIFCWCSAAS